jgi:predicted RNA methylase
VKKLSPEALTALADHVEFVDMRDRDSAFRITQTLDRKTYVEVNRVLEHLGFVWNRKAKLHVLADATRLGVADALDQVLADGAFVDTKRDLDQFYTPAPLAEALVQHARIGGAMAVLEPSAGDGAIAFACYERGNRDRLMQPTSVEAIELHEPTADKLSLRVRMFMHVTQGDFLAMAPGPAFPGASNVLGLFDRVVMNPPFSRQRDIDHVSHAFRFLKPGGRLVAVMSAGTAFRQNAKAVEFRGFVHAHGGVIEPLPDDSFRASGTGVRTVRVTIDRAAAR